MDSKAVRLEQEFSCPVCYNIYEDPVVLTCSHSFCKACLKQWWTKNPMQECPVCKTKSPTDNPSRNLVLKNLCEAFLQKGPQKNSVVSEDCSLHTEKLKLFCLDHLQPVCVVCRDSEHHANHSFIPINEAARQHKAEVQKSLELLKDTFNFLQKDRADWVQAAEDVKVQVQKTEKQIEEDFEKLRKVLQAEREARICALKMEEKIKSQMMMEKIEDLNREIINISDSIRNVEKHLEAPDVSFLQNYKTAVERTKLPLPQELQWPSGALRELTNYMETLRMFSLVEPMKHLLRSTESSSEDHESVSPLASDLRKYACKLTLDIRTAYRKLILSEDNKQVSYGRPQYYPILPERFFYWDQVLCREGLTGRCYWEVDWEGWVSIGVTYRGISRKGNGDDSCLGSNDKSWVLECSGKGYTARHNNISTPIPLSSSLCVSYKVGVYVDWPAGSLSFYTVSSDTLTHIHTFTSNCAFTEDLLPAFRVVWGLTRSSVTLC